MSIEKECGACKHWHGGTCYRFPPQMVPHPWDNQHPITYYPTPWRPQVAATERACGEWKS